MPLLVWSERSEPNTPHGEWRDCSYSAYLDGLVYGGLIAYPKGIYTVAQREAFEDASGLPESQQEQGTFGFGVCDHAARTLFGTELHKATRTDLPVLLGTPGIAVAVQGCGPGLPSGYTGNHAVCVVPLGGGDGLMYDPLRPNKSLGVPCKTEPLIAWNARLSHAEIRWIAKHELVEVTMGAPSLYQSVSPPQRVLDTRIGVGLAGKFTAGVARQLDLRGVPGVPEGATAISANLTVTNQTAKGYLAVTPTDGPLGTSTLNFPVRDDRANGGTFQLADGCLWITYAARPGQTCDVILDLGGVYIPAE
jgi:hypothetical protein